MNLCKRLINQGRKNQNAKYKTRLDYTKDDWGLYLRHLVIKQADDIGDLLGISGPAMTKLVKLMTDGKDLTASKLDRNCWHLAVECVKSKATQFEEASK